MTPHSTRLVHLLCSVFIVVALLTAVFITLAHAESRRDITQITHDLPKVQSISEQLFGQDSRVESHGLVTTTNFAFCDENGKNCHNQMIGAWG